MTCAKQSIAEWKSMQFAYFIKKAAKPAYGIELRAH
jgi:hypothetical protein